MCRLDVLLQAEVVCATLSGAGSHQLIDTVIDSTKMKVQGKTSGKLKKWEGDINTTLNFDAVVMVRVNVKYRNILGYYVLTLEKVLSVIIFRIVFQACLGDVLHI